jgi:hypothetical protein
VLSKRNISCLFFSTIQNGEGPYKMNHNSNKVTENALIETTIESWKFARLFLKLMNNLDAGDAKRYSNQLSYFTKKIKVNIESAGLSIVDLEGQRYDPGIAASALNIGGFEPDDELIVDQMLEPIIMSSEGIRKEGTVLLRKVHT